MPWVTCASTTEMNRACEMLISEGDHVLELGAQLQATSENIAKAAGPTGAVFQLDVARKVSSAQRAAPRPPEAHWHAKFKCLQHVLC